MRLKLICLAIMLILAFETAAAQSGIDVILKTYDSTSSEAKVQIINLDDVDYSDIYLTIDTWNPVKVVNILGAKSSAVIPKIISPGEHILKVTTKEGVSAEKKLNFLKTASQIQEEIKEVTGVSDGATGLAAEKEAQRIQELREKQREFLEKEEQEKLAAELEGEISKPEEEAAKPSEEIVKEPKGNESLIILPVLLFLVFIIYLLLKKRKK